LSFRSWTGRETTSTSRLIRLCMGTQYIKWRTSQTTRRWSPAVAIRQLPWSFDMWPQEGLPTSSSSPEWVTGSIRALPVQILATKGQLALCRFSDILLGTATYTPHHHTLIDTTQWRTERRGLGGSNTAPPPRTCEVLSKLSQIPCSRENTYLTT
jgi:hypothetical protein